LEAIVANLPEGLQDFSRFALKEFQYIVDGARTASLPER
jgi:hypothetical protein